MGGSAGGAATSGATVAGAGGMGPVLQGPASGGFDMRSLMGGMASTFGPRAGQGNPQAQEQIINQLATRGPPPPIQPMPFEGPSGVGQTVGKALLPPTMRPVLPRPINMPMMKGESSTRPPTGIGEALRSY